MNKGELVEAMAQRAGLDKLQAKSALNAFVDVVMDAAQSGDKVGILGFGTFNPTSRGARTGRNPQTGAPVKIPASKSVRFVPGDAFKSALNTKRAKKAAPAKKAQTKKSAPVQAAAKKAPAKTAAAKKVPAAKKAAKSTKKK